MTRLSNTEALQILELDSSATLETLRTAFKKQALKWHPDKNPNNVEEAEAKFKDICCAYETLMKSAKFRSQKKNKTQIFAEDEDASIDRDDDLYGSDSEDEFEVGPDVYRWFRKQMERSQKEEAEQIRARMWREEELLDFKQRRRRYHQPAIGLDKVVRWKNQYRIQSLAVPDLEYPTDSEALQEIVVDDDLNNQVAIWHGQLTRLEIDAIANAANTALMGGGGVDGAIHAAAGYKLHQECGLLGGCKTGRSKITRGYDLPAKYVIHTCGPVGFYPEALKSCYITALNLAIRHNIKTIALPCISTGNYGFPLAKACQIVLETVRKWLNSPCTVDTIYPALDCKIDLKELKQEKEVPTSQASDPNPEITKEESSAKTSHDSTLHSELSKKSETQSESTDEKPSQSENPPSSVSTSSPVTSDTATPSTTTSSTPPTHTHSSKPSNNTPDSPPVLNRDRIDLIIFACYLEYEERVYHHYMPRIFPKA